MGDIFSLMNEEVDAGKFDGVSGEKGSALSTLIRQSMKIDEDIATTEQHLKDLKFRKKKVNEETTKITKSYHQQTNWDSTEDQAV